jgi:hypothetical protein
MRPGGALVGARRCACSLVPCGLLPRCGSGARATRPHGRAFGRALRAAWNRSKVEGGEQRCSPSRWRRSAQLAPQLPKKSPMVSCTPWLRMML